MGRDKGKFNKRGGRGGSSRFQATSAEEIEQRNSRIAAFDERRAQRRAEDDDDAEEVQEGVEAINLGEGDGGDEVKSEEPKPLTRKQREEADKARKAAEYRRRHELGLTEEYKRDMEKLAEVRKRREDAVKKAAAEKETAEAMESERKSQAKAAKAAAVGDDSDSDSDDDKKKKKKKKSKKKVVAKLDKIAMKKMKPAQLKEALKDRDLDIQGNAKTLLKRLMDYEASR